MRSVRFDAPAGRPVRRVLAGIMAVLLWVAAGVAGAAPQMDTPAKHALLVDMKTGTVLLEKAADVPMPPASMSKLMTTYMLFERLKQGRLSLDDTFPVSENAWRKGGSKMFVEVNSRVSVEDLIRGIVVQSGNDACIVVAEALAGSEAAFAEQMTRRARELGLTNSVFRNATGWPDPGHYMTAHDLARLAERMIRDFPEYYKYYSETEFTYNGIKQGNRNPLLYKNMGADGLKTGHTEESGYGLTASVERDGRRLILVINGLSSTNERSREAERLIEWGFREFGAYDLFAAGETVDTAEVWLGEAATVPLVLEEDLAVTLDRQARRDMKVSVQYEGPVAAPIRKGQRIATLVVTAPDSEPVERPLLAGADVERRGLFGRIGAAIGYFLWGAG